MSKFSTMRLLVLVISIFVSGCFSKNTNNTTNTSTDVPAKNEISLDIKSPETLKYVTQPKIDIEGSYSLPGNNFLSNHVEVKIGEISATEVTSTKYVFKDFPLMLGQNNLEIKLFLNGEQRAVSKLAIVYSDFYTSIISPEDGHVFRQGKTDIVGTFQYPKDVDPKDIKIKIDSNLEAKVNSDGTFEYQNYSLKKGTHEVTASIEYKNKIRYTSTSIFKFYDKNVLPDAKLKIVPPEGKSPLIVKFDGSESTDVDGKIVKYFFNFGDGQILESATPKVEHTYKYILRNCKIDDEHDFKNRVHLKGNGSEDGDGDDGDENKNVKKFKVELTVVDNDNGVSTSAKKVVTVKCQKNSPPTVGHDQTINGFEDQSLTFNLNQATDVDNDPLTYTLVSPPNIGSLINCLDGLPGLQCIYIPKPNYFGPVTFKYKVNDGIYDSDVATVTLNIAPVNDIPEMKGGQNFTINEDTPISFILNGATDVDGDILKYRIVNPPQNGKLENCLNGTSSLNCKFTPDKDFNGSITFSYIANDGTEDAASPSIVSINVLPVNDAPLMIGDQSFNGLEDNPLSFTLSGATDVENDHVIYSVVAQPENGRLDSCLNGTDKLACTFVPNKDFNGKITFTYKANDGKADSTTVSTVTLNISPVNDAPTMIADQTLQTNEDTVLSFNLNGANDVDGDVIKYRLIASPNVGTITGCLDNTSSKNCTYIPPKNYFGTITFTYIANDGVVDSDSISKITINVLPVNDAPEVGVDQVLATSEDTPLNFSLSPGSDVEGDVLKYRLAAPLSSGQIIGCLDNTTSLNCTFVPAKDFNGPVTITYKVNDGSLDSEATGKISINVAAVNDAPVVGANQNIIGQEDTILNFKVSEASDVDGDKLTYKIVKGPTNGVLSGCLNNTSSTDCQFIPDKDFNGTVEILYKVNDGALDSELVAKITLNILPVNDAPVMRGNQTFGLFEDQMTVLILSGASDVDNDNLTYSLVKTPIGGTLSGCLDNTGSLICTFTPDLNFNGKIEFTYKANDGKTDSETTSTVTLNVWAVNDPPVMGADQSLTMNENTSLTFTVNKATDVEGDPLKYKVVLSPSSGTLSGCMNDDENLTCTYTPVHNFSGDVVIRYRARDGQDSTTKLGTINIKVLMVNTAPIMAANTNFEVNEDESLDFTVPTATDNDNDTLTYKIVSAPSSGVLSGCLNNNSSLDCHYTPPENFNGVVSFTYKANDGRLDSDNVTEVIIKVKPINDIPYVGKNQSLSLNENSHIDFSLSKGGDVDGDELIYKITSAPNNGTISGCLNNSNSIDCTYTPNVDFKGTDSLTYKVNDGTIDSTSIATITFTVNETNRAPVFAQKINDETDEDTPIQITLPIATDANGDAITYWLGDAPSNGKLENCLGGTTNLNCKFTPDKDFNGVVTFSYFAFDGKIQSAKSIVTINVKPVNDPPVMGINQEFRFYEDQDISFDLNEAIDVDSEKSLIFYSIVVPPSKGVLSNCLNFTNDLHCDYSPEKDFNGEIEFTYIASDGIAFSLEVAKVKLNILPVNDRPMFDKVQIAEANANDTTSIIINPATDKDGDSLTYQLVDGPTNATLSNCLNGTNKLDCDFTPAVDFNGEVVFKIRAYDGKEYSDVQTITVSVLVPAPAPIDISSGGGGHVCALINNGDVYCWGTNDYGQLGLGNTQVIGDNEFPVSVGKVQIGGKATKISLGFYHTCALLKGGLVKCWGANFSGQLGQGNTLNIGDNELPASIPNIKLGGIAIDIVSGGSQTCALLQGGNIKCWGYNADGELGQGNVLNIGDNETPDTISPINLGKKATQVVIGSKHTCALLEDGNVKCWGANAYQQCSTSCSRYGCSTYCQIVGTGALGLGRNVIVGDDELPSAVENVNVGEKVIKLAASGYDTCAILESGNIKCWGQNIMGSLGYGNTTRLGFTETPSTYGYVQIGGVAKDITMGGPAYIGTYENTCVIFQNDKAKCWGSNVQGQLGQGNQISIGDNEYPSSISPIQLDDDVLKITTSGVVTCVILKNKKIRCFGYGGQGALGIGQSVIIGDNELPTAAPDVKLTGKFPIARFEINEITLQTNKNLIFNGMTSTPSETNGSIESYKWDFGDGSNADGAIVSHTYTVAGNYEARLIIADDLGVTSIAKKSLTIAPEPLPKAIIVTSTTSGFASLKVNFDGSNSIASETGETIVSYDWDYGDGQAAIEPIGVGAVGIGAIGSGKIVDHVYVTPGVYTAKLTVTDSKNRKHIAYRNVAVFDSLPPYANFIYSSLQGKHAPVDVGFDATSSTPGSFDGSIVKYEWDFGDGETATSALPTHKYSAAGIYKVVLKVTDERGKNNTKEASLNIPAELQPGAVITASAMQGPRPLRVNFDGSSSYPANSGGTIIKYEWTFEDGTTYVGASVNHAFENQGLFDVTLEVTDDVGKTSTSKVSINVKPSNPPIADFTAANSSSYFNVPVTMAFDGSPSIPGDGGYPIVSYIWKFSDGVTLVGKNVTHIFNQPGSYDITLKVVNSVGEYNEKTISKVFLDPLSVNIFTNNEVQFEGNLIKFDSVVHDQDGKLASLPITWISSDNSIIKFSSNGVANTITSGIAYVTAKVGNNSSQPLKVEVKKRTAIPELLVSSDYFLKNLEENLAGGVFSAYYVSADYSPVPFVQVISGLSYTLPISIPAGVKNVEIRSNTSVTNKKQQQFRFFDGHGNSLLFDGKDDVAQLETSSSLLGDNSFSFGFWTRLGDVSVNGEILKLLNEQDVGIRVTFDNRKIPLIRIDSSQNPIFLFGNPLVQNEWTHLLLSYDSVSHNLSMYQNGRLIAQRYATWSFPWRISNLKGALGGESFKGLIDELNFFDQKLTDQQVSELMFNKSIVGLAPKAIFSFEGTPSQVYRSGNSILTLGATVGYDDEDPSLRFSAQTLSSKVITPSTGGVLSLRNRSLLTDVNSNKISFEFPPFVLTQNVNATLEILDARTPGFLPEGIKDAEYLIRLYPMAGLSLTKPGILTLPISAEKYRSTNAINVFRYEKSNSAVYLNKPSSLDLNEQVASFSLRSMGTYFSSYDISFIPQIEYYGKNISDSPFTFEYDRRLVAHFKGNGSGPFNVQIDGSLDGAELYSGCFQSGNQFPLTLVGLALGHNYCELNFKKKVDDKTFLYLKHFVDIFIEN